MKRNSWGKNQTKLKNPHTVLLGHEGFFFMISGTLVNNITTVMKGRQSFT